MKVITLSNDEIAFRNANLLVIVDHTDLTVTAANTAQTIQLLNLPALKKVKLEDYRLPVPFEDVSDAAFNNVAVTLGDGDDVDRFLASTQVNVNGTEVLRSAGTGTVHVYAAADTLDLVVGSMAEKALADIDKGELHLYLMVN